MADRLPIYDLEEDLIASWRRCARLVLSAPTGSGKSTQIPRMLRQHGFLSEGQAIMLQPRRLAARLLAKRIAEEEGERLGEGVGYQIRFENRTSAATDIALVTEGVLLRRMASEPELPGVSTLIFDEFHERSLHADIGLAMALELQATRRPDLRILVMSATLESDSLRRYLAPCEFLESEGRTFPVQVEYSREYARLDKRPIWERAADAFEAVSLVDPTGDVLVFMPGAFEIRQTVDAIRQTRAADGALILPLHGELPPNEQDAAVARHGKRKVVVATNVAETSLTIDGVTVVIDSGLARIPRFDPYRGIKTLLIQNISQASADQRAGRAGRTAPGLCFRLWAEEEHRDRPVAEAPEVQRLDLSETILTLKSVGIRDLAAFRWLDAPEPKRLANAETLLHDLGALDEAGDITDLGRRMLAFPVHPRYARLLIEAGERGCVPQAALVAALSQGKDLLVRKVDRRTKELREDLFGEKSESDFFVLMRAYRYAEANGFRVGDLKRVGVHAQNARAVAPVAQQFVRIAERQGLSLETSEEADEALRRCLLVAFSDRLARPLDSGTLRLEIAHGKSGTLARESAVRHAALLVVAEVRELDGRDREVLTLCSLATVVEASWVRQTYPDEIESVHQVFWDSGLKRVYARDRDLFRGVTIQERRLATPDPDQAATLLAEEVLAGRLVLKGWDHGVDQWIARVNFVATHCPDYEIPPIDEDGKRAMVEQICHGALGHKEIKDRPVKPVFLEWLNPAQRAAVDRLAPERLTLSNGKKPKVAYDEEGRATIALRVQELYDVTTTPTVADGRVRALIHVLAPNQRPVQMTQDLENFWTESYPAIRSQLRGRYPKHEWR